MTPNQTLTGSPSAEAVFGSTARGDADAKSDRDILIVDDSVAVLRERTLALEAEGWSVAPYTYAKLDALARNGALFIQHLKLEASILIDRDGRLTHILGGFEPKQNYCTELKANAVLAALAGTIFKGARSALLSADILYVTVRNFGVLSLAERGIHVYAYGAIVDALEAERILRPRATRSLAALRFLKCLYRGGEREQGASVREALAQALAALPDDHFPRHVRIAPPDEIVLAPLPSKGNSAYYQLRD